MVMNKITLITGATAGIGRATAFKLAENKHNLIITGRREERLTKLKEELETEYDVSVYYLPFDIRNKEEVNEAIDSLPKNWQNIDVLVNNAGLAVGLNHLQDGEIEDWERMIDTNIKGLLYITRKIAPLMMQKENGHIVNVGSIAGRQVYEYGNVYCATKHAVDALSKSMRIDMLKYNIKVTQIAPGMAETEFSLVRFKGDEEKAKNAYKGFKALTSEDVANVIVFALNQPPHVTLNDIEITPTAQANSHYKNTNN